MATPSRQGNAPQQGQQNTPRVQYVQVGRVKNQGPFRSSQSQTTYDSTTGQVTQRIRSEPRQVPVPSALPNWLGNRGIIVGTWAISMAVVGYDDWHNNNIMPRPSRLWSVSLFYGLLALASLVPALVPIINAFAVGYTLMLIWNFYNKAGQFS